ncbi:hypothetical protein D3C75_587120 [compost metagenome]
MTQRRGLRGGFSLLEQRNFASQSLIQRQQAGGLHRAKHQARRQTALPAWLIFAAVPFKEICRQAFGRFRETLGGPGRRVEGDQFAGIGTGDFKQLFGAVGEPVEDPQLQSTTGGHRGAPHHHFQCRLRADQPRQALGTTGAGQQTEVDFRQAYASLWFTDAIAAGEREFQTTAQCKCADGGHQWFVETGQAQQQFRKIRRGKRSRAAELADVRACTEQAIGAEEDDGAHRGIGISLLAGLEYGFTQGLPKGVDRRTGQADQCQIVLYLISDQGIHDDSMLWLKVDGRAQNHGSCMSKLVRSARISKRDCASMVASSQSMK